MVEVAPEQLRRWATILTAADSCMSLVYWRGGITTWDTPSTPSKARWAEVMDAARSASEEVLEASRREAPTS